VYDNEQDPIKKAEIKDVLDQERRNLKYLSDEEDSQVQRIKRFWRNYVKDPECKLILKDRIKLLFKWMD
jgi:hypothetical protein